MIAAVVFGGLELLLRIFSWWLVDALRVFIFFEPFVEIALALAMVVVLIGGISHAIRHRHSLDDSRYIPAAMCLAIILIALFVPFTELYVKCNFYLLRSRRTAVAQGILAGPEGQRQDQGGRGNIISLPADSAYLSSGGGEVLVDHRNGRAFVLFFSFRGILDRFSGYVYSPTDQPPDKDEFLGDGVEITRLGPHWYWYAS